MNTKPPIRILHVDGDSFFASCEIALNPQLQGRPVWVGGGRRGDGIVIAANRAAKKFGIKTAWRALRRRNFVRVVFCANRTTTNTAAVGGMFHVLEKYSPMLVPISIDEGFLDFTTMDRHVWRNTTPEKYVKEICQRILREGETAGVRRPGQFIAVWPSWLRTRPSPASSKFPPARKRNF